MTNKMIAALAAGAALIGASCAQETAAPDPSDLLDKMAEAHGGIDRFLSAPAIRFRYTMHLTSLGPTDERTVSDSWRYYESTVDPDTSRAFVDIPHENRPGFEAGFDGTKLWRSEYSFDPSFQDGALMLSWYHYGMMALPFIAKTENVALEYLGEGEVPGHDGAFHMVRIDYTSVGWSGELTLFLDKETGLLRGWDQGAMFPPLPGDPLPGIPTPPGSPMRVADQYQEVDGLIFPRAYVSYSPAGDIAGVHMVLETEILDAFNASNAAPPQGAEVSFDKNQAN